MNHGVPAAHPFGQPGIPIAVIVFDSPRGHENTEPVQALHAIYDIHMHSGKSPDPFEPVGTSVQCRQGMEG